MLIGYFSAGVAFKNCWLLSDVEVYYNYVQPYKVMIMVRNVDQTQCNLDLQNVSSVDNCLYIWVYLQWACKSLFFTLYDLSST